MPLQWIVQGEDITDLAVLWSLKQEEIPTTLISTASRYPETQMVRTTLPILKMIKTGMLLTWDNTVGCSAYNKYDRLKYHA